jgi:predicted transcriptional regulator
MNTLTDAQKKSLCDLYVRHVKTSWINMLIKRYLNQINDTQLGSRLCDVYINTKSSDYGIYWLRFGSIKLLINPDLADKELESGTMLLCSHNNNDITMTNIAYIEVTKSAALFSRTLMEYILIDVFKHVPGDELFSICDNLTIHLPYRFNPDNPEPKAITLHPARSPGKQNERKVHRYVLADISERFKVSTFGSGTIKPKRDITIDCDIRLLDWFIDGIYKGKLDLNLIRKKQRKYAYKMLGETMVCTSQELGDKMSIHLGLVDLNQNPDVPVTDYNYYDSDSDSD